MKGFVLGIATMLFVLVLGMVFALMGFVSMRADNPPSKMETKLLGPTMDASVARAVRKIANPISAHEANLAAGARLYRDHQSTDEDYLSSARRVFRWVIR